MTRPRALRVAVLRRADATAHPGGDSVQADAITTSLRQAGMDVTVMDGVASLAGFDRAILFNLTIPRPTALQALAALRAGVPYHLFPVFWSLPSVVPDPRAGSLAGRVPRPLRDAIAGCRFALHHPGPAVSVGARLISSPALCRWIVGNAAGIHPNSQAEAAHLANFLGCAPTPNWRVVGNGLWPEEMAPPLPAAERDAAVLCAGAIGPRKNQLALVRAAAGLSCPVLIAGGVAPGCDGYAARLRAEAPANVHFLGPLPRPEVLRLMARTAVYCQPSYVETPGLASLEAAACGARPVLADSPPVREYFADRATYVGADDLPALTAALATALADPGDCLARTAWAREAFVWSSMLAPLVKLLYPTPTMFPATGEGIRP